MKKLLLLLCLTISSQAQAIESIYGDIFPYENKHSSFTVDVDTAKLDRFSIEVVYSTPVVNDIPFTAANVSVADDTLLLTSHNLAKAQPVLISTPVAGAPQPLATGTTYFVYKISDNLIKLATTYAQAVSGDTIDLLTTGPSTGTWTIRPVALVLGNAGFLWFGSNDATNYIAIGSVGNTVTSSTQAITASIGVGNGVRAFDWGEYAYRYIRLTFNGPLAGVIKLRAFIHGKLRN